MLHRIKGQRAFTSHKAEATKKRVKKIPLTKAKERLHDYQPWLRSTRRPSRSTPRLRTGDSICAWAPCSRRSPASSTPCPSWRNPRTGLPLVSLLFLPLVPAAEPAISAAVTPIATETCRSTNCAPGRYNYNACVCVCNVQIPKHKCDVQLSLYYLLLCSGRACDIFLHLSRIIHRVDARLFNPRNVYLLCLLETRYKIARTSSCSY